MICSWVGFFTPCGSSTSETPIANFPKVLLKTSGFSFILYLSSPPNTWCILIVTKAGKFIALSQIKSETLFFLSFKLAYAEDFDEFFPHFSNDWINLYRIFWDNLFSPGSKLSTLFTTSSSSSTSLGFFPSTSSSSSSYSSSSSSTTATFPFLPFEMIASAHSALGMDVILANFSRITFIDW